MAPSNTPGIASSIEGSCTVPAISADKIRENRLRRMAERQGLAVQKSRRRDPDAYDFGTYMLVDLVGNAVVASGLQSGYGMTLDDVERYLRDDQGEGKEGWLWLRLERSGWSRHECDHSVRTL